MYTQYFNNNVIISNTIFVHYSTYIVRTAELFPYYLFNLSAVYCTKEYELSF